MNFVTKIISLLAASTLMLLAGCERPPIDATQTGYRGTGMADIQNPRDEKSTASYPAALPAAPSSGPSAGEVYQNVQVLGDLSVAEFTRLMTAMTAWVAPEAGCSYCHAGTNLASDDIYTKVVSRRMIQMTQAINGDWDSHVAGNGVNCYTCHRGKNVPEYIWFEDAGVQSRMATYAGNLKGQNQPSASNGYTSLPVDTSSAHLTSTDADRARVISTSAHPTAAGGATIQDTESVYGLMVHLSQALDVNCTYCHNTASFQSWETSNPARTTAYHGIDMVRTLNQEYLVPLTGEYPDNRLGPGGDAPKANCLTCHQGQRKPLNGENAIAGYPELAGQ